MMVQAESSNSGGGGRLGTPSEVRRDEKSARRFACRGSIVGRWTSWQKDPTRKEARKKGGTSAGGAKEKRGRSAWGDGYAKPEAARDSQLPQDSRDTRGHPMCEARRKWAASNGAEQGRDRRAMKA